MGRQRPRRIGIFLSALLVLAGALPVRSPAGPVSFFLHGGLVYRVDMAERSIGPAGSLHRTAVEVTVGPDGLVWGRGSPTSITALDPATGELVATIELPDRPYAQIITPAGMLYAAHNTLTREGFSMSVVDLSARTVTARIRGIQGLVTGLAQDGRHVYVAALGVKRPDSLYLYRIDTRTQDLEEVYRVPKSEYRWEIAVHEGRLYITWVAGAKATAPPVVEVMDLQSARIAERWSPAVLGDIGRFTAGITFDHDSACAPAVLSDGGGGIVVLDPRSGAVQRVLPVDHAPRSVVGVHEGCLVYTIEPQSTGTGRASLFFCDIRRGTAVGSVTIPNQNVEEVPQ